LNSALVTTAINRGSTHDLSLTGFSVCIRQLALIGI